MKYFCTFFVPVRRSVIVANSSQLPVTCKLDSAAASHWRYKSRTPVALLHLPATQVNEFHLNNCRTNQANKHSISNTCGHMIPHYNSGNCINEMHTARGDWQWSSSNNIPVNDTGTTHTRTHTTRWYPIYCGRRLQVRASCSAAITYWTDCSMMSRHFSKVNKH